MGRGGKDGEPDPASHCERGGSLEGLGQIQQLELSTSQGREGQRPGQDRKLLLSLTDCFPRMVPLKLHLLRVFSGALAPFLQQVGSNSPALASGQGSQHAWKE